MDGPFLLGGDEAVLREPEPCQEESRKGSLRKYHLPIYIETKGDVNVHTKSYDSLFPRMSRPVPEVPDRHQDT